MGLTWSEYDQRRYEAALKLIQMQDLNRLLTHCGLTTYSDRVALQEAAHEYNIATRQAS